MSTTRFIETFDGLRLRVVVDAPARDPKAVFVVSHGVGAMLDKFQYQNLAETVCGAGYLVYRYDQRGHGESEGERQFVEHYTDLFKDVKTMVDLARKENPGKKVFVFGNSMGAFSALGYAIWFPGEADGFILSVTGLELKDDPELVSEEVNGHGIHERFTVGGPEMQAQIAAGLVKNDIPTMSYGLAYAINGGGAVLKERAKEMQSPVLFINSVDDNLVNWRVGLEAFASMKQADRQYSVYGGATHEIYGGDRRDKVLADTVLWLDKHI